MNSALFLNERELAERWRISVKTLQAMRLKGGGPVYRRFGRLVRYAVADLEAFESAARRRSTSDPGSDND
ncbi:MAG: helix-turn-helix domain-containing protein [Bauldia sp.]